MHAAQQGRRREEEVIADSPRAAMLRRELEAARVVSLAAGARYRMAVQDPAADLCQLADLAEAAALQAQRVAGFARLLSRET